MSAESAYQVWCFIANWAPFGTLTYRSRKHVWCAYVPLWTPSYDEFIETRAILRLTYEQTKLFCSNEHMVDIAKTQTFSY